MKSKIKFEFTAGLVVLALGTVAFGGSFHFGETRYIPKNYSQPVIESKKNGKKTYIPSVPKAYKKYNFGAGGDTSYIGVTGTKVAVRSRPHVNIRLKDSGHVITVYQGDVFHVGDRRYKMLGVWASGIEYRDLDTGKIKHKKR